MSNDVSCGIEFLTLIAERKHKETLLNALSNEGAKLINVVYGRGSVKKSSSLMDVLGFVPEEHKVLITCLIPCKKTDTVFDMLIRDFKFDKPNTGMAFTVPVEMLSF